jgi:hypothetical protein
VLTTTELQNHLSTISYMPGWLIDVYDGAYEGQHCVIRTRLEDSYNPGEMVELDIHSMLPPMRTTEDFEQWLLWRLMRIATHEVREWLKKDGKPIVDPHADGADQDRRSNVLTL